MRGPKVIARVLRTSKTIKDWVLERPGGYKDYSRQKMEVIIGALLLAEDYKSADNFMLLLMQPQVKNMLYLKPVGKTRAKNTQNVCLLSLKSSWTLLSLAPKIERILSPFLR